MDFNYFRIHTKRHGLSKTVFRYMYGLINKLIFLKIFHCIAIHSNKFKNKHYESDSQFRLTIFDNSFWDRSWNLDEYGLDKNFLDKAKSKNYVCLGFLDKGKIASYTWYATETDDLYGGNLKVKFSDEFVLATRTYTHLDYRGKRLHALGIAQGLKLLSGRKYKGIVGIVEAINFSSLKGIFHFGGEEVGKFFCVKIRGKYLIFSIGNTRKYGL